MEYWTPLWKGGTHSAISTVLCARCYRGGSRKLLSHVLSCGSDDSLNSPSIFGSLCTFRYVDSSWHKMREVSRRNCNDSWPPLEIVACMLDNYMGWCRCLLVHPVAQSAVAACFVFVDKDLQGRFHSDLESTVQLLLQPADNRKYQLRYSKQWCRDSLISTLSPAAHTNNVLSIITPIVIDSHYRRGLIHCIIGVWFRVSLIRCHAIGDIWW